MDCLVTKIKVGLLPGTTLRNNGHDNGVAPFAVPGTACQDPLVPWMFVSELLPVAWEAGRTLPLFYSHSMVAGGLELIS